MTCSVCGCDAFNQRPGSWIIEFPYVYCSNKCLTRWLYGYLNPEHQTMHIIVLNGPMNTLLADRKDYKEGRELENNKKELV